MVRLVTVGIIEEAFWCRERGLAWGVARFVEYIRSVSVLVDLYVAAQSDPVVEITRSYKLRVCISYVSVLRA